MDRSIREKGTGATETELLRRPVFFVRSTQLLPSTAGSKAQFGPPSISLLFGPTRLLRSTLLAHDCICLLRLQRRERFRARSGMDEV